MVGANNTKSGHLVPATLLCFYLYLPPLPSGTDLMVPRVRLERVHASWYSQLVTSEGCALLSLLFWVCLRAIKLVIGAADYYTLLVKFGCRYL